MSNKSGSWKQSTSSPMYINLWSFLSFPPPPIDPVQYLHMCKRIEYNKSKGWNLLMPQTENLFGKCLKPHRKPTVFLLPTPLSPPPLSRKVELRNLSGNDSTHHPLLCLERRGYGWPTFESKLCCSWNRKPQKPNIARSSTGALQVLILICGIAIHTEAPRWVSETRCVVSSTTSANSVFECNINEARNFRN